MTDRTVKPCEGTENMPSLVWSSALLPSIPLDSHLGPSDMKENRHTVPIFSITNSICILFIFCCDFFLSCVLLKHRRIDQIRPGTASDGSHGWVCCVTCQKSGWKKYLATVLKQKTNFLSSFLRLPRRVQINVR